uniref:Uncharacterized protein n=1 Tax=Oryza barthii TaxID=65489 RepID=A0A0D3GZD6_9ORYZ
MRLCRRVGRVAMEQGVMSGCGKQAAEATDGLHLHLLYQEHAAPHSFATPKNLGEAERDGNCNSSTSSGCWHHCRTGTAHTSITRRSTPLPVCMALPAGCRRASEWMVRCARQRVGEGVRLDNGLADRDWYLPSNIVVDVGLELALREPLHLSTKRTRCWSRAGSEKPRLLYPGPSCKQLQSYTVFSEKFGIDMVHYATWVIKTRP